MAFEKLTALQNGEAIEEILALLDKLNVEPKNKPSALQHAISIINERNVLLEKLAQ